MRLVTDLNLKRLAAWALTVGTLREPRTLTLQRSRQRTDTATVRPAGWVRRTRTLTDGGAVARSKIATAPAVTNWEET
jgi:hypothetical protein